MKTAIVMYVKKTCGIPNLKFDQFNVISHSIISIRRTYTAKMQDHSYDVFNCQVFQFFESNLLILTTYNFSGSH